MNKDYIQQAKHELAHLVPTEKGATFRQLWMIFYYTRMFKYVSHNQYSKIKRAFNKICTYNKLQTMCELGYLKSPSHKVYCATNKVLPVLKAAGFITEVLPAEPKGEGYINELLNTDVFVDAVKLPYFYTLLHCNFDYLKPDALLVQLDDKGRRYKLTFLEIEAQKSNWSSYLEKKRDNYLRLAKDEKFFLYWKNTAPKLHLPSPHADSLKFSVAFICNLKKDFGNGFQFIHSLSSNPAMD